MKTNRKAISKRQSKLARAFLDAATESALQKARRNTGKGYGTPRRVFDATYHNPPVTPRLTCPYCHGPHSAIRCTKLL